MSFKRSSSLATAITKRVGRETVHCSGMPAKYAGRPPTATVSRYGTSTALPTTVRPPLRHWHGLAADGAFLDQLESLHPVCEVERAGDGGLELVLGEPAHKLLLRLGHQGAATAAGWGRLGRRRGLAAPAGVVAIVETDHRHVLDQQDVGRDLRDGAAGEAHRDQPSLRPHAAQRDVER